MSFSFVKYCSKCVVKIVSDQVIICYICYVFLLCFYLYTSPDQSALKKEIVIENKVSYSKTCQKRPLKDIQNTCCKDKWTLNEGLKYSRMLGAFCNTFDLHYAKIGLEKQFLSSFLVDLLYFSIKTYVVDENCLNETVH